MYQKFLPKHIEEWGLTAWSDDDGVYHLNDTDKYTLATFAPNDWDGLVEYADRCLDDRLQLHRTILRIEHVSIIGSMVGSSTIGLGDVRQALPAIAA